MKRPLTQVEIDAMFRKAAKPPEPQKAVRRREISRFDLKKAGQLSPEQARAVKTVHETFARRLGSSLSAFLRVAFEVSLITIEQVSYGEYLKSLPELDYLATLRFNAFDARGTVRADLSLIFPLVDLVLGGRGGEEVELRELTEIEEEIAETIVQMVARELEATWSPVVDLGIQFEQRQQSTHLRSLMQPTEKILSLTFEVRLPDAQGSLNLTFPAVVSNALLRKLSLQWSYSEHQTSSENENRLRERLLDSKFPLDLSLPPCPVSVREIVDLEPGSVLVLPHSTREPIHLRVAGRDAFCAYPVRQGAMRAALIQSLMCSENKERKDKK
jgi:flagellar motor switch protein FliM